MRSAARGSVLALLALAACGLAAGRDYAPPVLTLGGTIVAATVPTPPTVHVAMVWKHQQPAGQVLDVFQELTVRAEFPARFQVGLPGPPPEAAMNQARSADGSPAPYRFSAGTLLVYDDRSGTGMIELAPAGGAPGDVILGAPERLTVYYLEGTPSAELRAQGVRPGFNLWREPVLIDPAPGAAVCAPQPAGPIEILPLDTDIQISLTASPVLTRLICEAHPADEPDGGPSSLPVQKQVTCSSDRTAFVIETCATPAGLCGQAWCYFECGSRPAGSSPPPGWPCP